MQVILFRIHKKTSHAQHTTFFTGNDSGYCAFRNVGKTFKNCLPDFIGDGRVIHKFYSGITQGNNQTDQDASNSKGEPDY